MNFSIIPQPQKINILSDQTVFRLNDGSSVMCLDGFERAHDDLMLFLEKNFEMSPDGMGIGLITFEKDCQIKSEGYRIRTDYDNVFISASDAAGAFYAVQTLKQLLLQGQLCLPMLEIDDEPLYAWRGFMLDSARYFFSVEDVKLLLDTMALHKLNRFHMHLTDDQGWRVELYSHLLLAQVGGYRAYTNFDKRPHGGFYSKQDIEDIVSYANDRFIKVIPEIDSPGHVVAAIAAYPELSCFERQLETATHSGVKHDVLCIGKESTFEFMFSVFGEICEMFPDKIIHIGGDEVMQTRWKICPHCQALMKEKGFENEKQLYFYYINRIAKYIKQKGFDVIMWNDDEKSEIDPDITWQFWNEKPDAESLSESKRKMIASSSSAYYFDLPYGTTDLKQCYEFEPFVGGLEENQFLGVEGCLWTEYVPDIEKAGRLLIPRLAAMSESAWTKKENKSFEKFKNKLPAYYQLIKTIPLSYSNVKKALPGKISSAFSVLKFEKRRLHWQGLHNIIDNKKVEKTAVSNKERKTK
ncbi:MAG: beta-N-acetylhexosaminidase [Acutalibacteraceae bacterium]